MENPASDINQDGAVDSFDLSILLNSWGTDDESADINGDGVVDTFDLSILLSEWGQTVSDGDIEGANPIDPALATHVIPLSVDEVDGTGNYSDVQPGDIVAIESGSRDRIQINNFTGTPENPIVFVNDGGIVDINTSSYSGIQIQNCENIRVTGSGSLGGGGRQVGSSYTEAQQDAGIYVTGINRAVTVKELSRYSGQSGVIPINIEVDHIECVVPAVAVGASDDDSLNQNHTISGLNLHHFYIHDTGTFDPGGGEGFYIGSSAYHEGDKHMFADVQIHHNYIARIMRDGIQIGCAIGNNSVHHNVVRECGLSQETSHGFNIVINRGATVDIYGNYLFDAARHQIYDQGLHGQKIYNNVLSRSGLYHSDAGGIRISTGNQAADNPHTPDYPRSTKIFNNTIVESNGDAIVFRNSGGTQNEIRNNILYNNVSGIDYGDGASAVASNNIQTNPSFVDAANDDYHLQSGSVAINAGYSLPGIVDADIEGTARPQGGSWDVGAFEFS